MVYPLAELQKTPGEPVDVWRKLEGFPAPQGSVNVQLHWKPYFIDPARALRRAAALGAFRSSSRLERRASLPRCRSRLVLLSGSRLLKPSACA